MILHAIELAYVGRFRTPVRLGPFAPGLNVISAPNEAGKSTLLRAAARGLFDRHTTKSDEIKALQPAGTDLAPFVAVEFETAAGRFRIEKTFLQTPRSLLKEWQGGAWQPVAEADHADKRLQQLLQSGLPGKGATKPEHWGLLGFLWARQGEPAEWPGLEGAGLGEKIRARLARVELDPVIARLQAQLAATADALLTGGGKPKVGGAWATAEADLAALETDLAAVRRTQADLDEIHRRYRQADADVGRLEQEHAERLAAAGTAREQAAAAERLRHDLETHRRALGPAQERLGAVTADADAAAQRGAALAAARAALRQAETDTQTAAQAQAAARTRLETAQAARPGREAEVAALRAKHRRAQALLRGRRLAEEAGALDRRVAQATALAAETAELAAKLAALPALTPAKLRQLEERADAVRTLRAQTEALGLTVELTPERAAAVEIGEGGAAPRREELPAGETRRLQSPQALDLRLAGWGRVTVRSGARDAQTAAADLARAETALAEALAAAEVPDVAAGREALAARQELAHRLKTKEAALAPHLGEFADAAALQAAAAGAARRAEAQAAAVAATAEEQALGSAEWEAAEAAAAAALPGAEQALQEFGRQLDALAAAERAAGERVGAAQLALERGRAAVRTLEAQIADLAARYPAGLDAAKQAAQLAFAQAEARVAATTLALPPEFEKLPERNKRAAAALQQIADTLTARRSERDEAKGKLESLGGQGLYSRETELTDRLNEAALRRDAARTQAWCARLAHDLIDRRKQAATKAVLTPLEERLTAALAELSGETGRRVFLDEQLQIAGVGPTRESAHAFELLSQGAKEQLLLCLRLAVAQELAADEPQVLILDDVLVNTDPVRQERILDVLGAAAARLQIVILTCHDDRYRGTGTVLKFA